MRIPTVQDEAIRDLCRTAPTWWKIARGRGIGCRSSCWATAACGVVGRPRGPSPRAVAVLPAVRCTGAADNLRARSWGAASRDAQLVAIEADLAGWYDRPPFAAQVARLAAYRGVSQLGALTLAAEVGDWRGFARAAAFMGSAGWCPASCSSGQRTCRGQLTKAGNAHPRAQLAWAGLVLPAPPEHRRPARPPPAGPGPQVVARAWAAQVRLCACFRRLAARKISKNLVVAAIARELAGFLWAEMTA